MIGQNPGLKQLHDMQAQQQKQVADQRRRMMEHAWWAKQQETKRQEQERATAAAIAAARSGSPLAGQGWFQPDEQFARVQAEVDGHRRAWEAGRMTPQQFEQKLQSLMIQDRQGAWWIPGATSGAWYRFDGRGWVQSSPPGQWVRGQSLPAPQAQWRAPAFTQGHPFRAIILFPFLAVLVAAAGFVVGYAVDVILAAGEDAAVLAMLVAWALGSFLALRRTLHTWRGG